MALVVVLVLGLGAALLWSVRRGHQEHQLRLAQLERERNAALSLLADREDLARRLTHSASHDPLTGLANRALLTERITAALLSTGHVAVMFLDLDDFKAVNDELGHAAGDLLLRAVSERLLGSVRTGDTVARLGGDEFAVLFPDLDADSAAPVLQRILAAVCCEVPLGGRDRSAQASAGLAFAADGEDAGRLIGKADLAMYHAKDAGGGGLAIYAESMHQELAGRLSLQADLAHALTLGQLSVAYQPLVSLTDGALVGFEALLRWRHPTRGLVPPDVFIPVAERSGEIDRIGDWVLTEALGQLAAWQRGLGHPALSMAVNLSTHQLGDPLLPERVRHALQRAGVDPRTVTLEITESLAMDQGSPALQRLWQLKSLGVRLALDDFGTGHSSLARLSAMPIDKVKIDKSFISPLVVGDAESHRRATLLRAAVAMTHGLGLQVVAEGVETEEHLALLRALGCHEAQGYLLGRPADPGAHHLPTMRWSLPPGDPRLLHPDAGASSRTPAVMPSVSSFPAPRRTLQQGFAAPAGLPPGLLGVGQPRSV